MNAPARPYLLFAGPQHYPSGGWSDCRGSYETADAARAAGRALVDAATGLQLLDWWHVVDAMTGDVVALYDVPIPDAEHVGEEQTPREIDRHAFVEPDDTAGLPDWAVRCQRCGHAAPFGIHYGWEWEATT